MTQAVASTSRQSSLVFPEAPSAARTVWLVALRELTDQMTSLRFLTIALLAVGLTPLVIYVGVKDYGNRLAEHDRLTADQQKGAREKDPVYERGELKPLRVVRPPEPLSVLVRGLDGAMPAYWDFSPAGIGSGPSASRPRRLADVLGQLDFEFLLRVTLGLLAILIVFDAVAGQKELGTLRAVLSQPISRAALLAGKLVGGAGTLLVPVILAFLAALLSSKLYGVDLLGVEALGKVAPLICTSSAYLVCFYALGLLISCLTSSQKTSLVVLLVTWVVIVLAMPPLATLVAQAISPAPPTYAVEAQKAAIDQQLHRTAAKDMGAAFWRITGISDDRPDREAYGRNRQAVDQAIAPILNQQLSKRRQLLGELDRDLERREERQRDVARIVMAVSPAATFANAAAELAGTGDAHYSAWLEAIHRQQSRLESALFNDPVDVTFESPSGDLAMTTFRRDALTFGELPRFVPPRGDALTALARALPSLGLLIAYTGIFVVGGFIAFARYDVR